MGEEDNVDRGDDFKADPDLDVDQGDEGADKGEKVDKVAPKVDKVAPKVDKDDDKVDKDDDKVDKDDDKRIPKAEFDKRIKAAKDRADAAEKKARELEEKAQASASRVDVAKLETELDDLEEELDKALADNNPGEKKVLRRAIREKQAEISDARMAAHSSYASALAIEQVRYDAAVDKLEASYDFLVGDSDDFDEELTGAVLDLKKAYEASGMPSSEAVKKAEKTLRPQLKARAEELKAAKGEAKDEKKDIKDTVKAAEVEAKRRADAVTKGLEAKGKQPASGADTGAADKKVVAADVKKMSDKDFEKLDKATLADMRGDNL